MRANRANGVRREVRACLAVSGARTPFVSCSNACADSPRCLSFGPAFILAIPAPSLELVDAAVLDAHKRSISAAHA